MSVSVTMPRLGESVTEGTVTRWLKKEGERVEADEPLLEVSTDKVDTEIPSPVSGILRGITVAEDETVAVGAELAVIDETGGEAAEAPAAAAEATPAQAPPAAAPEYPQAAQEYAPPAQADAGQVPPAAGPPAAPAAAAPPPPAPEPAAPPPAAPEPASPAPAEAAGTAASAAIPLPSAADGPYVTPLVRKLAAEHGVDLAAVTGTGVGGRIRKQDVLEAARGVRESAPAAAAPAATAPAAAAPAANG